VPLYTVQNARLIPNGPVGNPSSGSPKSAQSPGGFCRLQVTDNLLQPGARSPPIGPRTTGLISLLQIPLPQVPHARTPLRHHRIPPRLPRSQGPPPPIYQKLRSPFPHLRQPPTPVRPIRNSIYWHD
jgi:hypothetical protein